MQEKQFENPDHTPIIIILDGKCKVVNPNDGYVVATLKKGDVIGDSDFLKYTGYEFFGNIVACDEVQATSANAQDSQE